MKSSSRFSKPLQPRHRRREQSHWSCMCRSIESSTECQGGNRYQHHRGSVPKNRSPATGQSAADILGLCRSIRLPISNEHRQRGKGILPGSARRRPKQLRNDLAKFVAYVDHCIETGDLDPLREMGLAVPKRDKSPEEPKGDSTPKTPPEAPKEAPGVKTEPN